VSRPAEFVDPFIGVNWPGNGLCGPYLPNSLVRLGPDCVPQTDSSGYSSQRPVPDPPVDTTGYATGRSIRHFSHTHLSGTGGGGRYGNIGVAPFTGLPRACLDAGQPAEERAAAGYYSVVLEPAGIRAELTATPRVGVHRYTFPAGAEAGILIDAGTVVQVAGNTPGRTTGASIGGYVEWASDREVVGRADCRGGWGHEFPYSVFFYARFDRPAVRRLAAEIAGVVRGNVAVGPNARAVAHFGRACEVNLQVGISFVSVAKARASVAREAAGSSFDEVRRKAAATWDAVLSRIRVEGAAEEAKKIFYTLFTRLLCMPADLGVDDEFPEWHSGVRHFSDYCCLWDSVRNANSLIGLFDPGLEVDMLNCLLDVADHVGWLPDAWLAGHSAMVQGGSSADILICEAALKGLTGIDYERALGRMRRNNEVESPDPWMHGRYLADYRDLGYLSTRAPQCVSRHIEYAYQDWCIGELARRLGHADVAAACFAGARKLWNLWRDDLKCFAPRLPDGRWVDPFDPESTRPDSWNDPHFYEGTARQWSFSTHHDFAGLIGRHGGPEAFVRYLDRFYETGQYYPKETMLHVPYLYTYAGRPDKTAERVRACLAKNFHATRGGLNDNEDMGCHSAFYMCSTMGLYPVMGQDLYLLTAPAFTRTELALGASGKTLVIEAPGAGPDGRYVVSATMNGQPLDRAWVRHAEFADGAVVRLELAGRPGAWGTSEPPPSPLATPKRQA
jgi:predicted alpha-1,2-mannosidase